jgi:hypothetical protein
VMYVGRASSAALAAFEADSCSAAATWSASTISRDFSQSCV